MLIRLVQDYDQGQSAEVLINPSSVRYFEQSRRGELGNSRLHLLGTHLLSSGDPEHRHIPVRETPQQLLRHFADQITEMIEHDLEGTSQHRVYVVRNSIRYVAPAYECYQIEFIDGSGLAVQQPDGLAPILPVA